MPYGASSALLMHCQAPDELLGRAMEIQHFEAVETAVCLKRQFVGVDFTGLAAGEAVPDSEDVAQAGDYGLQQTLIGFDSLRVEGSDEHEDAAKLDEVVGLLLATEKLGVVDQELRDERLHLGPLVREPVNQEADVAGLLHFLPQRVVTTDVLQDMHAAHLLFRVAVHHVEFYAAEQVAADQQGGPLLLVIGHAVQQVEQLPSQSAHL